MKKLSVLTVFYSISLIFACISYAWAGQVVTNDIKAWTKMAIDQEKMIDIDQCPPNTVAILYFFNKTGNANLDPLRKGIALMLITDLSKVEKIKVVERIRLQSLVEELGLGVSGLVSPETAPEIGNILCARTIVGGDILKEEPIELKLSSNLLDISLGDVFGTVSSEGALQELFRIEKDLLFKIIEELDIYLTPEERMELEKPLSTDIRALLYLFQGIELSDDKKYDQAASFYEQAKRADPGLSMADDLLQELRSLGLLRQKSRERTILKDLRQRTSLTDTISPDIRTKRIRTPAQVETRQSIVETFEPEPIEPEPIE